MKLAACREMDPNFFFPHDARGVQAARLVCKQCIVREECLEYALVKGIEHGVWGGESERERRRMATKRRLY